MLKKAIFLLKQYKKQPVSLWENILYDTKFGDFLCKIKTQFYVYKKTIERFFFWGWKLKKSHDWDFAYLEETIYFKLQRMYKCFRKYGSTEWCHKKNDPSMKQLKIALELSRRLCYHDYEEWTFNYLNQKYGEFSRKGWTRIGVNVHNSKQYEREMSKLLNKSKKQKNDERKWLFNILAKYSPNWWD